MTQDQRILAEMLYGIVTIAKEHELSFKEIMTIFSSVMKAHFPLELKSEIARTEKEHREQVIKEISN